MSWNFAWRWFVNLMRWRIRLPRLLRKNFRQPRADQFVQIAVADEESLVDQADTSSTFLSSK